MTRFLDAPQNSADSRPAELSESNQIYLIQADDSTYLPPDLEVWPIHHAAILELLRHHPVICDAAVEALKLTTQEIRGLQNRDVPPGTGPRWW